MKTILYVDGFNLYYGAVKDTSFKWLNIHRMCDELLGIKYFTAKIISRPDDPQKHRYICERYARGQIQR